jgi:HAE1 family hydrophobic/amphiphilic exporter-1
MTVFVADVAQVIDGVEQPKNLAMFDTKPALALDVLKQSGANTVAVADGIGAMVARMAGELPPGRHAAGACATTPRSSATPSTT